MIYGGDYKQEPSVLKPIASFSHNKDVGFLVFRVLMLTSEFNYIKSKCLIYKQPHICCWLMLHVLYEYLTYYIYITFFK